MAKFGAKYPCFAPIATEPLGALPTYGTGAAIGKLVAANLTVAMATGELYADDDIDEQVSEFASGSLALETNDMLDSVAASLYGATVTGGEVLYNKGDSAPYGGLAYYKVLMRGGVKYYQGYFYPKVRAIPGNDNAQTRNNSITFSTTSTTFTVFAPNSGDWRITKTFADEASAIAWVQSKVGVGTTYKVNINTSGVGSTSPSGSIQVAAGSDVNITITGTVEALYDNGVESKASIVDGVYSINSIAADHDVIIAF